MLDLEAETGGKILILDFLFYIVKHLIPISALLPTLCVCEKFDCPICEIC